jgi:ketosteroid isomerase-like protein
MQEKRIDGFDKLEELYETLRGKMHVDRYEMIDPKVELSDRMAVLTYNLKSYAGEALWHWNYTEVYRLDSDNQWKIVHNHWSLVQPQAK